jgi:hypothetical protein
MHLRSIRQLFVFALAVAASPYLSAQDRLPTESRIWTDRTGKHRQKAAFQAVSDGVVQLQRPDGKTISVPVEKLSVADQRYVSEWTLFHRSPEPVAESIETLLKQPSVQRLMLPNPSRHAVEGRRRTRNPTSQPVQVSPSNAATPYERFRDIAIQQGEQIRSQDRILDPDELNAIQSKRLKQIQLQLLGPSALLQPEVVAELKCSLEQRGSIDDILKAATTQDWQEKSAKLARVLTAEQRSKWSKLVGKQFKGKIACARAELP